jgi:hypothetical protein
MKLPRFTVRRLMMLVARLSRRPGARWPCDCCQVRCSRLYLRLASGTTIRLCASCESQLCSWLADQSQDYGPEELAAFRSIMR